MDDYSGCKVDPTDSDFVDKFEQLHQDFQGDLFLADISKESLYTYIVLTYDVNSPYVIKYRDWAQRRRETARVAGFPTSKGKYTREAEAIILGRIDNTNKILLRYLFLQNDTDFIRLQGYQTILYGQMMSAMSPVDMKPSEASSIKKNIDDLSADIQLLQKQIFQGNESKELMMALYDFSSNITYDFRPEDIAKKKEKGEELVDETPYPKKYKPDKMKFVDDK